MHLLLHHCLLRHTQAPRAHSTLLAPICTHTPLPPSFAVHWVDKEQLPALEFVTRFKTPRTNVGVMMAGQGGYIPDVFDATTKFLKERQRRWAGAACTGVGWVAAASGRVGSRKQAKLDRVAAGRGTPGLDCVVAGGVPQLWCMHGAVRLGCAAHEPLPWRRPCREEARQAATGYSAAQEAARRAAAAEVARRQWGDGWFNDVFKRFALDSAAKVGGELCR